MSSETTLRYWRAVAELPAERARALTELESCFHQGSTPGVLSGPYSGRLLTTTFGYGLDGVCMALSRLWMPWKGKSLERDAAKGRNLFSVGFRWVLRVLWPSYRDIREEGRERLSAFRFTTWEGPSALDAAVTVFKIDYDHDESPALLIRPILDELVQIDEGLYLGQALMRWKGEFRRLAWFSLSTGVPW